MGRSSVQSQHSYVGTLNHRSTASKCSPKSGKMSAGSGGSGPCAASASSSGRSAQRAEMDCEEEALSQHWVSEVEAVLIKDFVLADSIPCHAQHADAHVHRPKHLVSEQAPAHFTLGHVEEGAGVPAPDIGTEGLLKRQATSILFSRQGAHVVRQPVEALLVQLQAGVELVGPFYS